MIVGRLLVPCFRRLGVQLCGDFFGFVVERHGRRGIAERDFSGSKVLNRPQEEDKLIHLFVGGRLFSFFSLVFRIFGDLIWDIKEDFNG
jgi:hypothetical protein